MASGLFALLDDVAVIAKMAAASIDDVAAASARATTKAAGVVIDDAAVTPRYVTGFTPDRELPLVWQIARGSLRNKLLILMPAFLLLAAFLPGALTPLLMLGGAYLCFEAAEKLMEKLGIGHHAAAGQAALPASADQEKKMVAGAIRTDLILSAEIMAIALGTVEQEPLLEKAAALIAVALGITLLVYGAVALIVKADDVGVRLARQSNGAVAALGRGLVNGMPAFLALLGWVGLAAMLWVGGHIVIDGLHKFGLNAPHDLLHALMHSVEAGGGVAVWLAEAGGAGLFGLALGALIVTLLHAVPRRAH